VREDGAAAARVLGAGDLHQEELRSGRVLEVRRDRQRHVGAPAGVEDLGVRVQGLGFRV